MAFETCFTRLQVRTVPFQGNATGLRAPQARALAELLQVLACGEESAMLAFEHLGGSCRDSALREALAGIAADEACHQALLVKLGRILPEPAPDPTLQAAIRRFFLRLADRDAVVHCARIAAIDSGLCHILAVLRNPARPLAKDPVAAGVFSRIHRDEARHVAITRRCSGWLLGTQRGRDIVVEARERLVGLLQLRAASFDALSVDPELLLARLRRPHLHAGSFG